METKWPLCQPIYLLVHLFAFFKANIKWKFDLMFLFFFLVLTGVNITLYIRWILGFSREILNIHRVFFIYKWLLNMLSWYFYRKKDIALIDQTQPPTLSWSNSDFAPLNWSVFIRSSCLPCYSSGSMRQQPTWWGLLPALGNSAKSYLFSSWIYLIDFIAFIFHIKEKSHSLVLSVSQGTYFQYHL